MSSINFTQIPAQSTLEFYNIITSMYLNPAIITSTVKFINEIILIYFSARLSSTESRSMLPNLSLVMEFL